MVKKCGFCKEGISEDCAFEVCERCGHGIWGEKMFKAIKDNMESARVKGDLYQGSVGNTPSSRKAF